MLRAAVIVAWASTAVGIAARTLFLIVHTQRNYLQVMTDGLKSLQEEEERSEGAPFKPFCGLSGVVPGVRDRSVREKPRSSQTRLEWGTLGTLFFYFSGILTQTLQSFCDAAQPYPELPVVNDTPLDRALQYPH